MILVIDTLLLIVPLASYEDYLPIDHCTMGCFYSLVHVILREVDFKVKLELLKRLCNESTNLCKLD